jgi:hypothetical protein
MNLLTKRFSLTCTALPLAVSLSLASVALDAAVLIPVDAAAWDRGAGAADGTGNGGLLQTTTIEQDLDKKGQPDNPAVWTVTSEAWPSDFQGQNVDSLSGSPWIVYDLGTVQNQLEFMYIITNVEANRGFKDIEVFYSTDLSTNTISTWASLAGLTDGASNVVDYDFNAGGWTQLGASYTLIDANDGFGAQEQPATAIDLSGVSAARYIGLRGLSTFNDDGGANPFGTATGSNSRAGINQIAFTAVPEPSAALLGLLGLLILFWRR